MSSVREAGTHLAEERREADERVLRERRAVQRAARVGGARGEQAPQERLQRRAARARHRLRGPQLPRRERDRRHLPGATSERRYYSLALDERSSVTFEPTIRTAWNLVGR